MQCADGKTVGTRRRRGRREVVPGVSSLTTCDELREARSEIKRVPENLRGSARSNYLHEARGVRTVKRVDIFFFFVVLLFSRSFRRLIFFVAFIMRYRRARWRGARVKEIILDYFLRSALLLDGGEGGKGVKERTTKNVELKELNTTHKLRGDPRGARRTAGRNLISLANEFLSKSRVSRLM